MTFIWRSSICINSTNGSKGFAFESYWFNHTPHRPRLASRWYNLWIPIRKDPEPGKDIDEDYFVGNLVIVAFVGLLTLLLHLLLVSAVEAYWLQAKEVHYTCVSELITWPRISDDTST